MSESFSSIPNVAFVSTLQKLHTLAKQYGDEDFLVQPEGNNVTHFSWKTVEHQVRIIAQGLVEQGIKPGDKVGLLSKNCANWFIADWALMQVGAISVPIFATANQDYIKYLIEHANITAVFVGKLDEWQDQKGIIDDQMKTFGMGYETDQIEVSWNQLLTANAQSSMRTMEQSDVMSLVYTSGSSGEPKAIVLRYGQYALAAQTNSDVLAIGGQARAISYLPLAHITERAIVEGGGLYGGATIYFADSLETFNEDIKRCLPTHFLSVPRLWLKFQSKIFETIPQKKLEILLSIPGINWIIKKKLRAALGLNKTTIFGSGTAGIPSEVIEWFYQIGIPISEGWGMTETSGLALCNLPFNEHKIGTVGGSIGPVDCKLADSGELMIKGPLVFTEYYKDQTLTEQSFVDGYFATGDLAQYDESEDSYKIVGRCKEPFKSAKGKYVVPAPIESELVADPLIDQACVMGANMAQPIALVCLSELAAKSSLQSLNAALDGVLVRINQHLAAHERLGHIYVCAQEWSAANGLQTPTLKMRRHAIEARYLSKIGRLAKTVVFEKS